MAGIHVSGGTYSGSGDITIDWFWAESHPYEVWLPDGTMTITSETDMPVGGDGHCFRADWPGSQDYWHHQSGTVKVTTPAGTNFGKPSVNADGTTRVGQLYNLIINQDGYGASLDPVVVKSSTEGSHLKFAGNLTITSGTFKTDSSADKLYEILGGLILKTSGSYIQGYSGDAGFPAGFQYTGHGDLKVGYIEGQDWNGGDGVQLVLSSGTTTINSANSSDQSFVFHDQRAGHVFHSSGTVRFEPGASVTQKLRWSTDGLAIYNAVVSGGASSVVKGFMSGNDYLTFTNDLTIDAGTMGTYGDKLRVTGNAVINSGTLDTHTTNGTTTPHAMGSLHIKADGTYNATAYTTEITSRDGGGYGWKRNAAGTYTPNDGTVVFNMVDNSVYVIEDEFYNLTVDLPHASYNELRYSDIDGNGLRVNNDFLINDGHFKFDTAADDLLVSGTLLVSGGSTFGITNTPTGDHTIGKLDNIGTYNATTGETIIDMDMEGDGTQYGFQNNGTFNNNSGTVVTSGSGVKCYINFTGSVADPVFYNLTTKQTGDYAAIHTDLTVENILDNQTYFMMNGGYNDFTLTMGTTGSEGIINNNNARGFSTNYLYYKDLKIKAASEAYPTVISGSDNPFTMSNSGQLHLENVDLKVDYTTEGTTGGVGFIVSGSNNKFDALTIAAGDYVTILSGQRVTFGGALNITGSVVTSGSLINFADGYLNYDGAGWLGNETTDIMFTGVGTTNDFAGQSYKHIVFNGTGESKLNWTTSFPDTPIIVAGGTFKPDHNVTAGNISIANGGTWDNDVDVLTLSSGKNFSNRGGLFASSSAVFTDGVKGVSSQYVQAATFSDLNSATSSTMEVWFKVDNTKPMDQAGVINPLGTNRMQITISSNPVSASGNYRLGFEWENGGTEIWNAGKVQDWDDTQWHHAAMTCDDTDGYKLYFDGKLEASGAALGNSAGSTVVANPTVMVGGQSDYGEINRAFAGTIARASIWDTALSAAQIRKMMFEDFDAATTTNCVLWWQFDEGEGGTVVDRSGQGNTGTLSGSATNATWANGGTWTAGGTLSSSAGNLYIGNLGTAATVFGSSYFTLNNRKLISGSKFASKAHEGTDFYYVATSGTNDYMNYSALAGAPIVATNDLDILANSYFNFDTSANNNQCDEITNYAGSTVRIVKNADFYTQDFDNKGTWLRDATYDGIIHDDGSTPHEYEPIDLMDDQDSYFDVEDLID